LVGIGPRHRSGARRPLEQAISLIPLGELGIERREHGPSAVSPTPRRPCASLDGPAALTLILIVEKIAGK